MEFAVSRFSLFDLSSTCFDEYVQKREKYFMLNRKYAVNTNGLQKRYTMKEIVDEDDQLKRLAVAMTFLKECDKNAPLLPCTFFPHVQ